MNKFNFTAAPGYVIVEPIEERMSKGGIALPSTNKSISRGKVLSYSPKKDDDVGLKAGNVVHFFRVLHIINDGENKYFVLAQDEVLATEDN